MKAISIQVTGEDAPAILSALRAKAAGLEQELRRTVTLIQAIESQVAACADPNAKAKGQVQLLPLGDLTADAAKSKARKAPPGENLRVIQDHISKVGPATVAELNRATGIGVSSIQAVMKRSTSSFRRDEATGRWSLVR
jgi:hypothetical protein